MTLTVFPSGGLNQGQQSTGMGLQTGGILGQQSQAGTGTGLSFGMGLGQQNTGCVFRIVC